MIKVTYEGMRPNGTPIYVAEFMALGQCQMINGLRVVASGKTPEIAIQNVKKNREKQIQRVNELIATLQDELQSLETCTEVTEIHDPLAKV